MIRNRPSADNNPVLRALSADRIPLGIQCFSGCASFVEIMGLAGFDFVILDTEHACLDSAEVETLIRAADAVSLPSIVRVAENSETPIRRALEAGAVGVVIPRVETVDDVVEAIRAARYPPVGSRGMCPATRAAKYSIAGWPDYVRASNETVLIIPLLETPLGVKNVSAICEMPDVKVVFFGPGDFAMSSGIEPQDAVVGATLDAIIDVAQSNGTSVMSVPYPDLSADACANLVSRGVRVLLHSVDELLFYNLCVTIVTELTPRLQMNRASSDTRK